MTEVNSPPPPYIPPRQKNSVHILRSQDYLTQNLDNATILNLDKYLEKKKIKK
uniref:Uncharacterized protein n=1 Tax=viral metagenome TaxID=1070528 RepID=A0A6C0F047_9ZZZZ